MRNAPYSSSRPATLICAIALGLLGCDGEQGVKEAEAIIQLSSDVPQQINRVMDEAPDEDQQLEQLQALLSRHSETLEQAGHRISIIRLYIIENGYVLIIMPRSASINAHSEIVYMPQETYPFEWLTDLNSTTIDGWAYIHDGQNKSVEPFEYIHMIGSRD